MLGDADRTKGKHVWKPVTQITHMLEGWTVVAQYRSESGSAVHTVESNGSGTENGYRCTCQGFRIHKRGHCKHTDRARVEGLR
jgi:hypothetical protein